MSLLNDMLRNLDARRQSPGPDAGIQVADPAAGRKNKLAKWLIVVTLAAGLGAAFVLGGYQVLDQTSPPVTRLPMQPEDAATVIAEASATGSVLLSQSEVNIGNSFDTLNEMPVSQNVTPPLDDSTQLLAKQPQRSATQSEQDPRLQSASATPPGGHPSSLPSSHEANQGASSILQQPAGFYAVQLVALQHEYKILKYARAKGLKYPLYAQIQSRGRISYVLLLGVYPDRLSATRAMDEWIGIGNLSVTPWIRQLGPLQDAMAAAEEAMAITSIDYDIGTDKEIQQLLLEAELAMIGERLTSPAEDNAYDRYRRVLELIPEHPQALAGINQVVAVYLELAGEYLDSGNLERARLLVGRAEWVGGHRPEIALLKAQLGAGYENQQGSPVVPAASPALANAESIDISVRQKSAGLKTEQAILKEVENLLQRNAESEARDRLEQFLVTHPDSVATIEALFKLYLQLDDPDMAEQLLARSSQVPFLTAIELGAQLKVQQGNLIGAVTLMETTTPNYEASSYYALLAGLYQKTGRFREAAGHYRQLLRDDPEQGTYWLGLAVSLDSLQQYQAALDAFRRTRDIGQYDGDVQQYIEQRIRALSR